MTLPLHQFDLNLLRALDALLRERSVTRAAEQLYVTQQAMSGSLKRLREHFEDPLLERIGSRLEPTPLGSALAGPVREVLLQSALAIATRPAFDPAGEKRRFRIAMSDYSIFTILPAVLARLAASAPGIACDVHPLNDAAFTGLEAGDLEISIIPSYWRLTQESRPGTIRSNSLFDDDFVCVIDPAVQDRAELTLAQYTELSHAAVRIEGPQRTIVEDAWVRHRISPRIAASTVNFAGIIFMLPGTPLVATTQRRLAAAFAPLLGLRLVECPIRVDALAMEMSWHARSDFDPAHRFVRDVFERAALDIAARATS